MNDPEKIERVGVGILGLVAILLALYSTVTRYFLPSAAPDWGEETVVYLCVWALWLSVGRLVRRNEHVQAEVVIHLVSPRVRRWLEIGHSLIGIAFCSTMGWAGMEVVALSLQFEERSESSLHLPLAVYYLSMPTGMAFMVWAYGLRLLQSLRGRAIPVGLD